MGTEQGRGLHGKRSWIWKQVGMVSKTWEKGGGRRGDRLDIDTPTLLVLSGINERTEKGKEQNRH